MSHILNNLQSKEKDIIENLAQSLRKKMVKKDTLDQKLILEYRKADDHYTFDPKKHMNLSKSDIQNLD